MGIYMVKTARHVHTRTKNSSSHLEACQAELKGVKLKDYAGTKTQSLSMDFGMLMHKCMYLTLFFPDVITMKS